MQERKKAESVAAFRGEIYVSFVHLSRLEDKRHQKLLGKFFSERYAAERILKTDVAERKCGGQ